MIENSIVLYIVSHGSEHDSIYENIHANRITQLLEKTEDEMVAGVTLCLGTDEINVSYDVQYTNQKIVALKENIIKYIVDDFNIDALIQTYCIDNPYNNVDAEMFYSSKNFLKNLIEFNIFNMFKSTQPFKDGNNYYYNEFNISEDYARLINKYIDEHPEIIEEYVKKTRLAEKNAFKIDRKFIENRIPSKIKISIMNSILETTMRTLNEYIEEIITRCNFTETEISRLINMQRVIKREHLDDQHLLIKAIRTKNMLSFFMSNKYLLYDIKPNNYDRTIQIKNNRGINDNRSYGIFIIKTQHESNNIVNQTLGISDLDPEKPEISKSLYCSIMYDESESIELSLRNNYINVLIDTIYNSSDEKDVMLKESIIEQLQQIDETKTTTLSQIIAICNGLKFKNIYIYDSNCRSISEITPGLTPFSPLPNQYNELVSYVVPLSLIQGGKRRGKGKRKGKGKGINIKSKGLNIKSKSKRINKKSKSKRINKKSKSKRRK